MVIKIQFVKYTNIFQETMNDALTDLVRDMNKFRGQVEKSSFHDEDISNL